MHFSPRRPRTAPAGPGAGAPPSPSTVANDLRRADRRDDPRRQGAHDLQAILRSLLKPSTASASPRAVPARRRALGAETFRRRYVYGRGYAIVGTCGCLAGTHTLRRGPGRPRRLSPSAAKGGTVAVRPPRCLAGTRDIVYRHCAQRYARGEREPERARTERLRTTLRRARGCACLRTLFGQPSRPTDPSTTHRTTTTLALHRG